MSLVTGQIAVLFEKQTSEGALAPALQILLDTPPSTIAAAEGLVLGVDDVGIGDSGLDLTLTRAARTAGTTPDGLTRRFDGLLDVDVSTLSFAWPISGNKEVTTTPLDGEMQFTLPGFGIGAILQSCGLGVGAALGPGVGWRYTPAPCEFISCLIFDSGTIYPCIDMKGSLEMAWTPSDRGVQTATFTSKLDKDQVATGTTFPTTVDYGDQDDVAAPVVELASNTFGPVRGWSSLSVTIDNGIETTPDSNAIGGERIEQSTREISFDITLDADSANPSFDYDNLAAAVAQTDDISFQVGADTAPGGRALAYALTLNNVNLQDLTPDQPARARAHSLTGFATSQVDGGELFWDFR